MNDEIFDMTNIDTRNYTSNIFQIDMNLKYFYFNDVIIYNQLNAIKFIIVLIDEYQNLFRNNNITIDISKKMSINLKSNVVFKSIKIYLFEQKNRKVIDIIFDKLYVQNKMHFTFQFTSYNYSMFVV